MKIIPYNGGFVYCDPKAKNFDEYVMQYSEGWKEIKGKWNLYKIKSQQDKNFQKLVSNTFKILYQSKELNIPGIPYYSKTVLSGKIISKEVWNMIPDDCKKIMKNVKKSFMESIEADVNNLLLENELKIKQKLYNQISNYDKKISEKTTKKRIN